jgi:hypothetical protein
MRYERLFILGGFIFLLLISFASAFDFTGYVKDTDGVTPVENVNVTLFDPFNSIEGEPWGGLTDSNGFFNVSGVNDSQQAVYMVVMYSNDTNYSNLRVGPMVPPMRKDEFYPGRPSRGGNISLNNLNWTLREGALINITAFNQTGDISLGGEVKDKKIDWPLAGWYEQTDFVLNGLVYVPRERNYTATIWANKTPPRGYFISEGNVSDGIHQLRVNTSTTMVNISGFLENITAGNQFARIRAYWLIGGDTAHFGSHGGLDGTWAPKFVNSTSGEYWHTVPNNYQ